MEDTQIRWIGTIPNNWKIIRLNNVTKKIYTGRTPVYANFENENYIIGQKNNQGDYIDLSEVKYGEDTFYNGRPMEEFLKYGDVLLNTLGTGSVGRVGYWNVKNDRRYLTDGHLMIFRNNDSICDSKFLYYALYSQQKKLEDDAIGSTNQAFLTLTNVYKNLIAIPDKKSQINIVRKLDCLILEIDKVVEKTKETIEDYKKYKHSIITEVITKGLDKNVEMKNSGIDWIGNIPIEFEIYKTKYLGKSRNGLTYSPEEMCNEDEGILVLRSSNIVDGKIALSDNVYVRKEIKEDLMVNKGDILICSRNGSRKLIGKNAIIDENLNASFGAFMMIFRSYKNSNYIKYILDSDIFNYYLGTFLTSTINQLTYDNFANMKIVYTDNELLQQKIVDYLDKKCEEIDKLIESKQKIIDELEQYKKSLIYEYVTGKKEVV